MASTEQSGDIFSSGSDKYLKCAFTAQQELFQLGMNLLQREMDAGRRIIGSRDFVQAFAACADLMQETVEDFSASTSRLFSQISDTGAKVVEDTAQNVEQVSALTTEIAQTIRKTTEKADEVVRTSVKRVSKAGQSAVEQTDQVVETAEKAQAAAAKEAKRPISKRETEN